MMLPARDKELVQLVDSSLADASGRAQKPDGTSWLACRPGCTPCCHGVFRISMLDAERLSTALQKLDSEDSVRATALRARAAEAVRVLSDGFPGDLHTGLLDADESSWEKFADAPEADGACPVLDPATGRCELYTGRPLTCRIFGPPVRGEQGIGICELCYVGADEGTVLAGQMILTHEGLEEQLNETLLPGETVIAWAVANTTVL